jgi:hypothetical protein
MQDHLTFDDDDDDDDDEEEEEGGGGGGGEFIENKVIFVMLLKD